MVDRSAVVTPPGDSAWVYDPTHNEIDFVSKASATLYSYSLTQGAFTRTLSLGGTPSSIAISPDDSTLVIGNATASPSVTVTRVNLANNAVDHVVAPASAAGGVAHIAVGANGAVIVEALGSNRFFTFQVADAAPSVTLSAAFSSYYTGALITSPNHRFLEIQDTQAAPSQPVLYDMLSGGRIATGASVNGFHYGQGDVTNSGMFVDVAPGSVKVFDSQLHLIKDLGASQNLGVTAAAAFSSDGRSLFLWDVSRKAVSVFDTQSWAQVATTSTTYGADYRAMPIASMKVVDHGTMLALNDGTHVELLDIQARFNLSVGPPPADPEPTLTDPVRIAPSTNVSLSGDMDSARLADLLAATVTNADSGLFAASGPGALGIRLSGQNLDYANNQLVSGTVLRVELTDVQNGATTLQFTAAPTNGGWAAGQFQPWLVHNDTLGAFQTLLAGADRIGGGPQGDVIRGYGSNDELYGAGGGDTIYGGLGDDVIYAVGPVVRGPSAASTYLRGEEGNDYIVGGTGFDDINGNMGADTASGGDGSDWVVGGKDDDLLFGDAGGDIVYGNLGSDTCLGGAGDDQVRGGQGADILYGGTGNDWLSGDRGDDTISGGGGADIFHSFSGAGLDRVLDFNAAEGDRVQLDPGTAYAVRQAGSDTVVDMGGGDTLVLVGVQASALPAGWIFGV